MVAEATSSEPPSAWLNRILPAPIVTAKDAVVADTLVLSISMSPASVLAVISVADVSIGDWPFIPVSALSNNVAAVRSAPESPPAYSKIAPAELIVIVLSAAVILSTITSPITSPLVVVVNETLSLTAVTVRAVRLALSTSISILPFAVVAEVTSRLPPPAWLNRIVPVPVVTARDAVVADPLLLLSMSMSPASVLAVIFVADVSIGD